MRTYECEIRKLKLKIRAIKSISKCRKTYVRGSNNNTVLVTWLRAEQKGIKMVKSFMLRFYNLKIIKEKHILKSLVIGQISTGTKSTDAYSI